MLVGIFGLNNIRLHLALDPLGGRESGVTDEALGGSNNLLPDALVQHAAGACAEGETLVG